MSMNSKPREKQEVLSDLKSLVSSRGFVYALVLALYEDFHLDIIQAHQVDYRSQLSVKEAAYLLGLLVKEKIDFRFPESPEMLISTKKEIYRLMSELHSSHMIPFINKMGKMIEHRDSQPQEFFDEKTFFGDGDFMIESIFYSGTGAYDVQYRDMIQKKYSKDADWLLRNREFNVDRASVILEQIKIKLEKKFKQVNYMALNQSTSEIMEKMREENPDGNFEEEFEKLLPMMEIYQYVNLFFDDEEDKEFSSLEEMREERWNSFYEKLLGLSTVSPEEFDNPTEVRGFLENFSVVPSQANKDFEEPSSYNEINSHPIIKLGDDQYFITNTFLLYEASYDSPFYWLIDDKEYAVTANKNRGDAGEEITFNILQGIFAENNTYHSVILEEKKGRYLTDIDVLCVLGNYALCVQIKSKRLTITARMGNDEAILNDFAGAVQKGYDQAIQSRDSILSNDVVFKDKAGNAIKLPENIDQVFVCVVTMENYPSLVHQTMTLLRKQNKSDPDPFVLSIFDLEIIAHYLSDPYDFLYYIRQRTKLMNYFRADEEIVFLSYHLRKKLWPVGDYTHCMISSEEGQAIDRNYYPFRRGITVPDEGDAIKNRWKNEDFITLCNQIREVTENKVPDIIFSIYDWAGDVIDEIVKYISQAKEKTKSDGKVHNVSIPPEKGSKDRLGLTFLSYNSNDIEKLTERLTVLCEARKYVSKSDKWVGLGCVAGSSRFVDVVIYNDNSWEHDEQLEGFTKDFYAKGGSGYVRRFKKIGRNEKCYCGSGIKYKKCCGKNK